MNSIHFKLICSLITLFAFLAEPALAAGGTTAITTLFTNVYDMLQNAALIVVTVAICWVGYKVLFGSASLRDVMPVIIGIVIIGSAAWIAPLLLGK